MISGPSTSTQSVAKTLFGVASGTAGAAIVADTGKCLTDSFSITNQQNLPVICGVNSGYHVYFDASDDCHSLNFQLGNVATGIASIATRTWSIKVTQYSCDYENLAPNGCDQWHFGSDASNYVQTFNFQVGQVWAAIWPIKNNKFASDVKLECAEFVIQWTMLQQILELVENQMAKQESKEQYVVDMELMDLQVLVQ